MQKSRFTFGSGLALAFALAMAAPDERCTNAQHRLETILGQPASMSARPLAS